MTEPDDIERARRAEIETIARECEAQRAQPFRGAWPNPAHDTGADECPLDAEWTARKERNGGER